MRDMETLLTLENSPYLWLALGAMLLTIEVLGASGIGFLFAGLGAVIAAVLAHLGWAETIWAQTAWFFAATSLWAVLLWLPMKKLKMQKHGGSDGYNNMVGDEAIVSEEGLQPNKRGKVRWSGTVMNAKLAQDAPAVAANAAVIIKQVKGTVLIVAPEK